MPLSHSRVQPQSDIILQVERERLDFDMKTLQMKLNAEQQQHERELLQHQRELEANLGREKQQFELEYLRLQNESRVREIRPFVDRPRDIKLNPLSDKDDIDVYLSSFERLADANKWPQSDWATRLAAVLTGKAREAFTRMPVEDTGDYSKLKNAILMAYDLTPEAYRIRFRSVRKQKDETHQQYSVRVRTILERWLKGQNVNDFANLQELLIKEQMLESYYPGLQIYLKDRKPKTVKELAEIADHYDHVHHRSKSTHDECRVNSNGRNRGDMNKQRESQVNKSTSMVDKTNIIRKCWGCGSADHVRRDCKQKGYRADSRDPDCDPERMSGTVNNKAVMLLMDSGCDVTLVNSRYVLPSDFVTGKTLDIHQVDGSKLHLPLADVYLHCELYDGVLRVGVLESLPEDVLLAVKAVPVSVKILKDTEETGVCVATRSLVRAQQVSAVADEVAQDNVVLSPVDTPETSVTGATVSDSCDETCDVSHIGSVDVDHHVAVGTSSDNQSVLDVTDDSLDPQTLKRLQSEDPTLSVVRKLVLRPDMVKSQSVAFFQRNGVYYCKWSPRDPGRKEFGVTQLVVPKKYRGLVLKLAHDIPWSGHLGIEKTKDRVLQNYYWPGVFKDLADYCRSCPECQKTACRRRGETAKLGQMPILDEPFRRVGIDIIGKLNRSAQGNAYILTIVDYATRYPEAIPLPSIETERVCDALVEVFSRVGIPAEILSDQGSNFMSELMSQFCHKMGINKIKTSPYHPMTNGLCEKFNGTLKSMLKKFVSQDPKGWDKYVPYLLFAYREVPQASMGFSPFELLYGRKIRGPLDILRECWSGETPSETGLAEYVIRMRERLETMTDIAREQKQNAQVLQKTWYDRAARDRSFDVGDKVLVLLPSASNKLQAKWQGPVRVTRKVTDLDYEVEFGKRKPRHVLHVNMLRKWHDRKMNAFLAARIERISDQDDQVDVYPIGGSQSWHDVHVNTSLSDDQYQDVNAILSSYADVLTDKPGCTNVLKHRVLTVDEIPVRQKAYRIPQSMKPVVKGEIDKMLDAGIIQQTDSPYASPIVMVKKSGDSGDSWRFCADYQKLNAKTIFDPQPMPRVDDLLETVGSAKFISTLDLSKGYWQILLDDEAKRKSAFVPPFGCFEFRVMPFGMQNSGATFTRLMREVLHGTENYPDTYIDDIVVYSNSWVDHCRHLRDILDRLRKSGLTAKPKKCCIGQSEARYLGHVIGNGKIKPEAIKVKAIVDYPRPITKREVRQMLGLASYYRRYVPGFANLVAPLNDLTKKNAPLTVIWTPECEDAFVRLKSLMSSAPILSAPNFDIPFVVQVDASDRGLGAVLSQIDKGEEHPVCFLSRKLLPREQNYSTIEKECLAIVWAMVMPMHYLEYEWFECFM